MWRRKKHRYFGKCGDVKSIVIPVNVETLQCNVSGIYGYQKHRYSGKCGDVKSIVIPVNVET